MAQIRIYSEAYAPAAQEYFNLLSQAVEDDGAPIAIVELCEATQLYEISLYGPSEHLAKLRQIMLNLQAKLDIKQPLQEEILPDIDWVKHSLQYLPVVETKSFFIYGQHHRDKLPNNKLAIEIEANQAFGTGHHATTIHCLTLLEEAMPARRPRHILDIGTGSGILAIGAAKLAQRAGLSCQITASDIDPIAVKIAQENATLNQVAQYITVCPVEHQQKIQSRAPFELIMANILAGPLINLAPSIAELIAPAGGLILSGILNSQAEALLQAYTALGFSLIKTLETAEWTSLYLNAPSQIK